MGITESVLEGVSKVVGKLFGTANERELRELWPIVEQVNVVWADIKNLSDKQLSEKTNEFRIRLLKGETEDDILPEAYAVCREANHRVDGEGKIIKSEYERITFKNGNFQYVPETADIPYFAHFDVQILGGIVLHQGKIAEMVTGEGKTLVATLPSYLNAIRPNPKWVEMAEKMQGEDIDQWIFKPYVMHYDEDRNEVWTQVDTLIPEEGDVSYRQPVKTIPRSMGVQVVTVNDYLAARDAEYNKRLFNFLDLELGAIQSHMDSSERIPMYMSDIVYGTNNEFGFDYLRDNLKVRAEEQVQRSRNFAIIDEVDSVLIDEARTPLIISGSTNESTDKYFVADTAARKLKGIEMNDLEIIIEKHMKQGLQRENARVAAEAESGKDYVYSERDHSVKLTELGTKNVLSALGMDDIYSGANMDMPHFIDNALKAHALYKKDVHYIISDDGQVHIVDEFTGRVLEGRRWSDGLHQAVEAKEGLKIKSESQTIASITFQNYFKLYSKLAGMTGTALTEAKEFMNIYKLGVVSIPTNRPLRRINYPDLIFGSIKDKYTSIADHVLEVHRTGRPILIGTVSIEHSEIVSESLKVRGIKHEVLNAKHHQREAEIVSKAGQLGQVTVATNMAGRGTDIKLGSFEEAELIEYWKNWGLAPKELKIESTTPEQLKTALISTWIQHYLGAKAADNDIEESKKLLDKRFNELGITGPKLCNNVAGLGGLHIIGSERHDARRIDNQLRGRSGRQGDPGSSRFFLSLEDDTMRRFAPDKARQFMQWAGLKDGEAIESKIVSRSVEKAQLKVEERNFEARKNVLEYDEVMNSQRLVIYKKRQAWLEDNELKESMLDFCKNYIDLKVSDLTSNPDQYENNHIMDFMKEDFYTAVTEEEIEEARSQLDGDNSLVEMLCAKMEVSYNEKEEAIGSDNMRMLEKLLLLETIDRKWMDHLYAMDILREGIHLESFAQKDPKIQYKVKGFGLFEEMWDSLEAEVAQLIMKITPVQEMELENQVEVAEAIHDDFDELAEKASTKGAGAGEASTPLTIVNNIKKVGGNDPCPCGSGKKYKRCCGRK